MEGSSKPATILDILDCNNHIDSDRDLDRSFDSASMGFFARLGVSVMDLTTYMVKLKS